MNKAKQENVCPVCQERTNAESNWDRMNRLGTSATRIAARCEALYQEGKWPTPLAEADREYLVSNAQEILALLGRDTSSRKTGKAQRISSQELVDKILDTRSSRTGLAAMDRGKTHD